MKKIAILQNGFIRGGTERFVINLCKGLPKDEYAITVINPSLLPEQQVLEPEVIATGTTIQHTTTIQGITGRIKHLYLLYKLLRKDHYDVFHTNLDLFNGPNLLVAWLARVPIRICHAHASNQQRAAELESARGLHLNLSTSQTLNLSNQAKCLIHLTLKLYQALMRWMCWTFANRHIGCSNEANDFLYKGHDWRKANYPTVIFNGIDLDLYKRDKTKTLKTSPNVYEANASSANASESPCESQLSQTDSATSSLSTPGGSQPLVDDKQNINPSLESTSCTDVEEINKTVFCGAATGLLPDGNAKTSKGGCDMSDVFYQEACLLGKDNAHGAQETEGNDCIDRRGFSEGAVFVNTPSFDPIYILSVGRFVPQKNPHFILEIMEKLQQMQSNIHLLWVGEGPLFEQIKSKAIKMSLMHHPSSSNSVETKTIKTSPNVCEAKASSANASESPCESTLSQIDSATSSLSTPGGSQPLVDDKQKINNLGASQSPLKDEIRNTKNEGVVEISNNVFCGEATGLLPDAVVNPNMGCDVDGGLTMGARSQSQTDIHSTQSDSEDNSRRGFSGFCQNSNQKASFVNNTDQDFSGFCQTTDAAVSVNTPSSTPNISFLGWRDDIPALMQKSKLLLMPSLYEGLSITLIEAQASGLPCLVSDTITRQAQCGLIEYRSLSESSIDWCNAIHAIIEGHHPMSINTQELDNFSIPTLASQMQRVFNDK